MQPQTADNHDVVIEGLRGLAALLVVYAHYWPAAGIQAHLTVFAFSGVDLFFVLSGCVFAKYFTGATLQPLPFYVRRFFRIVPLYVLGVAVYAWLRWGLQWDAGLVAKHLLFVHTWQTYEIAYALNPAFWSLPPEVEFYLALPLLALCCRDRRSVLLLLLLALALRAALAHGQSAPSTPANWAFTLGVHLPGLLCEFMVGALVGTLAAPRGAQRWLAAAAGLALLVLLAATYARLGDTGLHANPWLRGKLSVGAALAYGLVVWSLMRLPVDNAALRRLLLMAGSLSFGLYILHNATLAMAQRWLGKATGLDVCLFAFGGCLLLTWALHQSIEAPARRAGRRLAASLGTPRTTGGW